MLRTGIYKLQQLREKNLKDYFGKEKNISIYLYKILAEENNVLQNEKLFEIILNRFNSDRNVVKRTYMNRFDHFDNIAADEISKRKFQKNAVIDIAVSDGRASCYFLQRLSGLINDLKYTATDLSVSYLLHRKSENSKYYVITDHDNNIKEIVVPPFVWNLSRKEGRFYFLNNFLKQYYLRKYEVRLKNGEFLNNEFIDLVHPEFNNLIKQHPGFSLINYNLLEKLPGKYDVVRAMNILHFGYFTHDSLNIVLNNLYHGLNDGGLLIEGSNEYAGSPVEGAFYQKTSSGFSLVAEPESASRIRKNVLEFKPC